MITESSVIYKIASRYWRKLPGEMRLSLWKLVQRGEYQRIRFHGKTFVNGIDRSKSYRQLFPALPIGKSILDAGSKLGYYSLRACQEGAQYCRAVEQDEWCVNKLEEIVAALGLKNLEVVQADILSYAIDKDFDIVLCLNLVHHFETIERVEALLDALYLHARERLALIVLAPDDLHQPVTYDQEPDVMGGKRFLRIPPSYFASKYGQARVHVQQAITYGPNRYAITITKSAAPVAE